MKSACRIGKLRCISGRFSGVEAALLLVLALSCGERNSVETEQIESSQTGILNVPLIAGSGENRYRLGLSIELFNDISFDYLEVSAYSEETSARFELIPGGYSSYLRSWQVYKESTGGDLLPVTAALVSEPSSYFLVQKNSTSTLSYIFETNGVQVASGTGSLVVDIEVNETPLVCEPLGSTCGAGAWCPPSELTGRELECVVAVGPVGIGLPCRSAIECAPNLSCFDFGEGPLCSALCLSEDFGRSCESGGTCTPQGNTYGVCVPAGGTVPGPPLPQGDELREIDGGSVSLH